MSIKKSFTYVRNFGTHVIINPFTSGKLFFIPPPVSKFVPEVFSIFWVLEDDNELVFYEKNFLNDLVVL